MLQKAYLDAGAGSASGLGHATLAPAHNAKSGPAPVIAADAPDPEAVVRRVMLKKKGCYSRTKLQH